MVITHSFTVNYDDLITDVCQVLITHPLTISGGDLIIDNWQVGATPTLGLRQGQLGAEHGGPGEGSQSCLSNFILL